MKHVAFAAAGAFALFAAVPAFAQNWPTKPVRLVVPFAPAGPADVVARLVGNKLSEYFGQQVLIENRAGAGGNIGAAVVAKSAPDGYTVLATTSAFAVNVTLFAKPGYDPAEFIPTAIVASQPNIIFVSAGYQAHTFPELLNLARTNKLAFASPGLGTTPHLTGEYVFRNLAKLDVTPIHFGGAGPAVTAVVSGEPPIGVGAIAGPLPQVKAGKLRVLAVSSAKRLASMPDVPTLGELGFAGVEDYTWVGLFLPAGTPAAVVQKINDGVNRAIASADFRERLEQLAFDPVGGTPQQFADYVKLEIPKWARVLRAGNIKAE